MVWFLAKSYELDEVERRPFYYFWFDEGMTSGRINSMLGALGAAGVIGGLIGAMHWFWIVIGAALIVLLWRNYRRFRERTFFAIAERDRAGVTPPTHPDRTQP